MIKKLSEAIGSNNGNIVCSISSSSTNITDEEYDELFELSANGLMIEPIEDDTPAAWDMVPESIEDDNMVITGDFGQQGSHNGSVTIKLPLDKVNKYYRIYAQPNDSESANEIREIFSNHNWLSK